MLELIALSKMKMTLFTIFSRDSSKNKTCLVKYIFWTLKRTAHNQSY